MFISSLKDKISKIQNQQCIILNDASCTYGDILISWNKWANELKEKKISSESMVMVRGDFDQNSIGLMLALIENNSIYVPISHAVKDISSFQKISEITHFFDLMNNEFQFLNNKVTNQLTLKLFELKNPGLILFSSGTTGEPKAALHNISFMLQKYEAAGKAFTSIAFLLFDHIGGFNTVLYCLANGGTIVVPTSRSPENILKLIEKYKIEVLPTSPSFINMLLVSKAYEQYDISSLKAVTYGTEPMPQATLENFNTLFPQINLKQTYGLSEVGILKTKSKSSNSLWMKIANDDNHSIEVRDHVLWIKSKMSMMGYLNSLSPFDENGWFNTNDRVEVDGEYLKILGRTSDIINVGGEKVYPSEVESVILQISGIDEVIVKGEAHPLVGNIVTCYVKKSADENEDILKKLIKDICKEKLEKFKRPVKIFFSQSTFYTNRFKKKLDDNE